MMNDAFKKAFTDNVWFITTCGEDGPHAVPVGFKCVTDDGKLAFAVICQQKTMENYQANQQLVIAVNAGGCNIQVCGTMEFVTEGPIFDAFADMSEKAFKGKAPVRCAAIMTPVKGTCFEIQNWTRNEMAF